MARARGGDNAVRRKGTARGRRNRPRHVHIFTEGEVTERQYIDLLVRHGQWADPGRRVEHHIENATAQGKHRKPLPMVLDAIPVVREVEHNARKAGLEETDWNWPQVWVLFDRDDHKDIPTAFSRARKEGINIAYSHPCFELWRLLHYQNYTSTFGRECGRANSLLRQQPGFTQTYGKSVKAVSEQQSKQIKPGQVLGNGRYDTAKAHARSINKRHNGPDQNAWDPYTDVWCFVEEGLLLSGY